MADVVIDPKVPLNDFVAKLLNQFSTKAEIDAYLRRNFNALNDAYGTTTAAAGFESKAEALVRQKMVDIDQAAKDSAEFAAGGGKNPKQVDQSKYGQAAAQLAAEKAVGANPGADPASVADTIDAVTGAITTGLKPQIPDVVRSYLGGRIPTPDEIAKLKAAYNDQHPNMPVTTDDELWSATGVGGMAEQQSVLEQAFLPDPTSVWTYQIPERLGHGPTIEMSNAEHQAILSLQGGPKNAAGGRGGLFSEQELKKLVLVAAQANVWDANGRSGAPVLAALAAASDNTQFEDGPAQLQKLHRGQGQRSDGPSPSYKVEAGVGARNVKSVNKLTQMGLKFNEGMWMYGGQTDLAYLYALDPTLATRLATTPAKSWSDIDVQKANGHFVHGNLVDADTRLALQGFGTGGKILGNVATKANGLLASANGGSGGGRQQADPVQLRLAAKELYTQMFFKDPSAGELDQFTAQVQAGIGAAPDNQSVSPEARLQSTLEGTQQYQDLYHSKPSGVSDAEYRNQFQAAAQSQLGNVAPAGEAIRSGMRTGDYQTTVGAAANQAMVSGNNSTFLGRLAQTAALVNEMT